MKHVSIALVALWCLASVASAGHRPTRSAYATCLTCAASHSGGKDTLDLYLPEGRRNAPVLVRTTATS